MSLHDTETGTRPPRSARRWIPTTGLARSGLALGAIGFLLMPVWTLFGPLGAIPQFALMAAGGVCSLLAIIRLRERALLAFVGLLPLVLVAISAGAELATPH